MDVLNCRGRLLDLSSPVIMGVLNSTSDSFYSGSRVSNLQEAASRAEQMIQDGATIIDIGGMSTRPGAAELTVKQEITNVVPLIHEIRLRDEEVFISVDTYRSEVARQAIEAGADIINDISGGTIDPELPALAAAFKAPYILMHMRGTPATMQTLTDYADIVTEIIDYFFKKIDAFNSMGLYDIIIDPGFGFAKSIDQNYQLLNQLEVFSILRHPLLAGLSRKSMFWKRLGESPESVLPATIAANMIALSKGAKILRVHDVAPARQIIAMYAQLEKNQ
jgi:dihydropteroate synthase